MRVCSTCDAKHNEICSVMLQRKLDGLALNETKVKGTGECNFGSVVGIVSGAANGRVGEGVALLMGKRVLDGVMYMDYREASERLMWVKAKF